MGLISPHHTPKIIFEDSNLLVLDKPAGLAVHEGAGQQVTLIDFLAKHLPNSPLKDQRYGLVHRLDQDTSGLLLVAKTPTWFEHLKQLFAKRQIHKEYLALVEGRVQPHEGSIDIPLKRDPIRRTKMHPSRMGRVAITDYQVDKHFARHTYLRAWPKTGRTHQIRVHLASLGYPIVGDALYGHAEPALGRHFLHAHRLELTDPQGSDLKFVSPLPSELQAFLYGVK